MGFFKWRSLLGRWSRARRTVSRRSVEVGLDTPGAQLRLESLEDRCTPTSGLNANQEYVSQLYSTLLSTTVSAASLNYLTNQLNHGTWKEQVALESETLATDQY